MNTHSDKTDNHVDPGSAGTSATGAAGGHAAARSVPVGRVIGLTAAVALLVGIMVGPIINDHHTLAADPTTAAANEHTLTVSGSGEVSVAPDVADVSLGVSVTRSTVSEAQSVAATAMTAVIAAVEKDGVAAKDITTVNLSLGAVYDYSGSTSRLTGYQFSNVVKVTVRDLKKIAAVVDDSVAGGATTIQGIAFRLADPKTVEAQARSLAMADARTKADALASSAGVAVKGVASITETSTTPVVSYGATDAKAALAASTPIQGGTTDVVVSVTVSYLIG